MADETVMDASGLLCPLPVLRARKAMQKLASGDVLTLIATDPGAVRDVYALCEATGHRLLERSEGEGRFVFRIEKK
ncbi:MAG: sulfurtransferase TusA family protein [Geminicoccaceae bacterium]|nr:sulfurtransferase TusA family protein [Geminicoccaceae bacterium]